MKKTTAKTSARDAGGPETAKAANRRYVRYIREKTNQLLEVMGTESLKPEELDDRELLDFDPIGIIADSFAQVLEFLNENITELQQAKDELQAIFDATGVGISVIDSDFVIQRCNEKQFELLVEPQLAEVTGQPCYEVYCNKNSPGLDCPAVATFHTGLPMVVGAVKKKDKYFQVVTTPYARNPEGEVTKVIEVSLDITEKKKAEEAEAEQRRYYLTEKSKLTTVVECLSEGLLVLGDDDRIVSTNRAAGEITGLRESELVGRPLSLFFPSAGRLLSGEIDHLQGVEIPYQTAETGERLVSANFSRLLDAEQQTIGKIMTFRDITEEKKQQELYHRTEKMAAIGQLAAGIAHEINNPLANIMGYAKIIKPGDDWARIEGRQAVIIEQAQKCSRIVQGLLDYSRTSSSEPENIDLNRLLRQVLRIMEIQIDKKELELRADLADLPLLLADPRKLDQLLFNLLLNAVQAVHSKGVIEVRTWAEPALILVTVADSGPGVPPSERNRIFDPLYTTKPVGQGTGLGLSICAGIINELNGAIEVENGPLGGALFTVSLPVTSPPEVKP